jgi:biotin synthase-related radical SAM superfamily protein
VLIELADILGKLAPAARTADQRHAIQQHVAMIERAGTQHLDEPRDAADLAARIEQARRKFEEASEA